MRTIYYECRPTEIYPGLWQPIPKEEYEHPCPPDDCIQQVRIECNSGRAAHQILALMHDTGWDLIIDDTPGVLFVEMGKDNQARLLAGPITDEIRSIFQSAGEVHRAA